jgi:hypothetical protein
MLDVAIRHLLPLLSQPHLCMLVGHHQNKVAGVVPSMFHQFFKMTPTTPMTPMTPMITPMTPMPHLPHLPHLLILFLAVHAQMLEHHSSSIGDLRVG